MKISDIEKLYNTTTTSSGEKPCDPAEMLHMLFFLVPLMIFMCCSCYAIFKHERRRQLVTYG